MIATEYNADYNKDEVQTEVEGMTSLRRQGTADEIAITVTCLASSETSFMTGANVDINVGSAFP